MSPLSPSSLKSISGRHAQLAVALGGTPWRESNEKLHTEPKLAKAARRRGCSPQRARDRERARESSRHRRLLHYSTFSFPQWIRAEAVVSAFRRTHLRLFSEASRRVDLLVELAMRALDERDRPLLLWSSRARSSRPIKGGLLSSEFVESACRATYGYPVVQPTSQGQLRSRSDRPLVRSDSFHG
jgi:hypothetical protein